MSSVLRLWFISFSLLCRSPLFKQTTVRFITQLSVEMDVPSSSQYFEYYCHEHSRVCLLVGIRTHFF